MISDALYQAAFAFRKTKLWHQLYDSQIFAIQHADGTIGYCCVMGIMGEHLALAVYPGEEGLAAYRLMGMKRDGLEEFEKHERAFSQNCLMCSFVSREELRPRELAEVRRYCKANGITPRGKNAYPQFRRFLPHYFPWYLEDEKEQTHLLEGLQACMEVADKLENRYPESMGFLDMEPFDHSIPLLTKKGKRWVWTAHMLPDPQPIVYPVAAVTDELRLASIRRAPPSKAKTTSGKASLGQRRAAGHPWACDVAMYPTAMRQQDDPAPDGDDSIEPRKAPYFPYLLMVVDMLREQPLHMTITDQADSYAPQLGEALLSLIEEAGMPVRIEVRNDRTFALIKDIAKQLQIPLQKKKSLPLLAELLQDFYEHMTTQDDEEHPDDGGASFLEQLADPARQAMLPDDVLSEVAQAIRRFHKAELPEGLLDSIAAELRKRGLQA